MENHPLYKKLRQTALDNNYTVDQVRSLNFNQATDLLRTRDFSVTFLHNMKRVIIMALQDRDDEDRLQQVKLKIKTWLDTNFPNWEAEHGRENDKPYITIWLKGKP